MQPLSYLPASHLLGWAGITASVALPSGHNLWLNFSTDARLGTRVWVDAVTLTNHTLTNHSTSSAPSRPAHGSL